jgi:phosphate transport system protein
MERHFQKELESLKTSLVKMGSVVEENIALSIRSVMEKNHELALKVIESDTRVDALEIEIDNAIIDLLALQQPLASDLRFILAALKINNDLERIGDHAVNIAQAAQVLCSIPEVEIMKEIPQMAEITRTMLKEAIDSFILLDPVKARTVIKTDDKIDELNRTVIRAVIELLKSNKQTAECEMEISLISRNMERVADLATNIAEEVIFHAQARVVKHHAEDRKD